MKMIDPQASRRTAALYELLQRESGHRILLAQQECPGRDRHDMEMEHLEKVTGRLPAIRGLDYIHDDYDSVTDRALRWNDRGGIVSICWHTGVEGKGYPESQSECPDFHRLLSPGTAEYSMLMARWEDAAAALRRLQEADVPVLWRPFHEFDGQWFWWGKGGGEAFIRLWQLMVRTFSEWGLHNLIWVLGYADDVKAGWNPGPDTYDIGGSDTYRGETTHAHAYARLRTITADKPLAFHETGILPPVDAFYQDQAVWSWVMPWHTRWLTENNTPERLREWYHDPRAITLNDVPSF